MRTIRMTLSIILLFAASIALAQAPQSFRSTATGGTIDDNLDLSFDPIELRFIEGMHFYTNLSNLTSSTERLLSNVSDGEFMFGVALPNPWVSNLWTAVGYRMRNTETSNYITFDPDWNFGNMAQETGFGMLNYTYNAFIDTDGDGDWDLEERAFQEFTDYATDDSYSFSLNNSYLTDMGTFGALINRSSQVMTGDQSSAVSLGSGSGPLGTYAAGSQTFTRSITDRDISGVTEYDISSLSESGAFETTRTISNTTANLAFMTEWNQYELRGDGGFNAETDLTEGSDRYHGEVANYNPGINDFIDTYEETDSFEEKQNEEGSVFRLGGSIRETFQQGATRLNDGFWQAGVNMQFGGCDYEASDDSRFTSEEIYFDGADTLVVDYTRNISSSELTSDKGSTDDFSFGFWTVYNRQFGDNLTFGFGAGWNYNSVSRSTDYIVDFSRTTNYIHDDVNLNDWVRYETESFGADRTWEKTTTSFNCPVGLEYRTGKKNQWAWRCGSRFTRTSTVTTDDLQAIDSESVERRVRTEYDDGTETLTVSDNLYGSSKEEIHNTLSNTNFYYGMGYSPTANLQIDMIYIFAGGFDFIDSDFFQDLRISITLNN
jgi:hypothetical protein